MSESAEVIGKTRPATGPAYDRATTEPPWVRAVLIVTAMVFLGLFLLVPLVAVFSQAFSRGWQAYVASLTNADARAAIGMTLLAAGISVPLCTVFGLAAAWAIGKFKFYGRHLLITLIDLPFSVSPVIAGLIFVLLFGRNGWLGPWLEAHHLRIIYAAPGIVLGTMFVTLPFVARELIPLMEAQGTEEEEAAVVLGASGWQTFWRVTLPNIKWGVLYGVVLANARAMGEFGAVSVLTDNVRGGTITMPLLVEQLYQDHAMSAAFAVSSLLALLALVTLGLKAGLEWLGGNAVRR